MYSVRWQAYMEKSIFGPKMLFPFLSRKCFFHFCSEDAFSIFVPKVLFPFCPENDCFHFCPENVFLFCPEIAFSIFVPEMLFHLLCRKCFKALLLRKYFSIKTIYKNHLVSVKGIKMLFSIYVACIGAWRQTERP